MSYAFQVHGLFDDLDEIHLDYSNTQHDNIGETSTLNDDPINPAPSPQYRTAWFAPAASPLAASLGAPQATRFCSGPKFNPASPPAPMARVYTLLSSDAIDWNGDLAPNAANLQQDVNFDSTPNALFNGFNDWTAIRLDQMGAGRRVAHFQTGADNVIGDGAPNAIDDGAQDTDGDGAPDTNGDGASDTNGDGASDTNGDGATDTNGDGYPTPWTMELRTTSATHRNWKSKPREEWERARPSRSRLASSATRVAWHRRILTRRS